MIIRLHKGAKFQYNTPNNSAIVEVEDITIQVDSEVTQVNIYFRNDIGGPGLYCMTPEEFRKQLMGVNANQFS